MFEPTVYVHVDRSYLVGIVQESRDTYDENLSRGYIDSFMKEQAKVSVSDNVSFLIQDFRYSLMLFECVFANRPSMFIKILKA